MFVLVPNSVDNDDDHNHSNIEPSRFFFDGPGSQGKSGDWQLSTPGQMGGFRKAVLRKSCFLLNIVQKREGGQIQIKNFWGIFLGLLFQGSFEIVLWFFLGCFEVVFSCMFVPKSV